MHGTAAIGTPKLASAAARLRDLNPHVTVETIDARLTSANALDLLRPYDIVVDGTDNFPTRYLVNDACVLLGKPNVYGAIFRFEGQASLFSTPEGPCYRCLYSEPPPPGLVPSCAEGGVLGALPGIIGSIQALEAIKWIVGAGKTLLGRLLLVDSLRMQFRELTLSKDPDCPVCGVHPTVTRLIDYEAFCGIGAAPAAGPEISVTALRDELARNPALVVLDVREPFELAIASLPGSRHVPLQQLPARLGELDGHAEIVTLCHHGIRSAQALALLRSAGFSRVRNVTGGIDAWAREVDREMPRY
jgi:adenylyltransferase/sulfurtransferase